MRFLAIAAIFTAGPLMGMASPASSSDDTKPFTTLPTNATTTASPDAQNTTVPLWEEHPKKYTPADYPPGYTFSVLNSDCRCDRHKRRFCTQFRRRDPEPGACYAITKPSRSLEVRDPLVARNNPVVCVGYETRECGGRESRLLVMTDNTMCIEPAEGPKKFAHNSFRCWHETY